MGQDNFYINSLGAGSIPLVSMGVVAEEGLKDKYKAGLIQVRLLRDGQIQNDDLLECVPLLPRFLNVLPKPGESVFIFTQSYRPQSENAVTKTQRFWIGPLISQDIYLEEDGHLHANAVLEDGVLDLYPPNEETGAYGNPLEGDVILQGRYNTDIIQKNREIWIRAGKFEETNNKLFNSRDMGYIQLKYGNSTLRRQLVPKQIKTFQYETPEILINAQINTYSGTTQLTLPGGLPQEFYQVTSMKTSFVVVVTDDKKEIINSVDSTLWKPDGFDTRDEATNEVITIIDAYKGEKWKITSNSNEILDNYGRDANNKILDYVLFQNEPTEVCKTIQEVKIVSNNDAKSSVLNMVASKINLISYDGEHKFDLTDPEKLVDELTQVDINTLAHPLVYGDKLVEFLELMRSYVEYHVHNYGPVPADNSSVKSDVLDYDLNTILNHNINSN